MNDRQPPQATTEPGDVIAEAAAQARAELRPVLDEVARQIAEEGEFSTPADSWAWLARAGRSRE